MVNQGLMYPQGYPQFSSPLVLTQEASQGVQLPSHQVKPQLSNDIVVGSEYRLLDEKIRDIKGFSAYGMDAKDLCLVPHVVFPPMFKAPDLPKYKGLSCPRSHVIMYYRKMASYIDNDDLLIHCFQDSLFGAFLDWHIGLEHSKIRSWKDLSEAFLKQYKYKLDMDPTRLQLQNQAYKRNETFKEYTQRWREMASRVKPALTDAELVDTFMGILQGLYYEKMVGSSSSNFTDMVTIGERIENGLKIGKIASIDSQTVAKKSQGFSRKKEAEANVQLVYQPQYQQPPQTPALQNQQNNRNQNQGQHRRFDKKRPRHDQILVSYTQLLPYLVQQGPIMPKEIPPAMPPYNNKHNPNVSYAFHVGYIRHSTEDCLVLKARVQELIDQKVLSFSEVGPNVITNPLPNHCG
ncbi:uncharacterized protein LOC127094899 [Lathyrus oleraceus]|uniref:uncharacterized protein LOC127094899 n=1 Tax=Pisum sativum TaxID=3888 RepID=UPI0021D1D0DD|nr:uncharacterized protein LOC127094899 [Pisum sativum]